VEQLAGAMKSVLTDSELRQGMIQKGNEYVAENRWERRKNDYLFLVDTLCTDKNLPTSNLLSPSSDQHYAH